MRRAATKLALRAVSWLDERRVFRRIAARQHSNRLIRVLWTRASRPLRWRPIPILSGPGRGLRINLHGSAVAFATGTAERPMQNALVGELKPGDTFYDIGANVGFVTILAAKLVGPQGRVIAFEPVPENVAAIRENLSLNGIDWAEVHETAISRRSGSANLIVSDVSAFSRLASVSVPTGARGHIEVRVDSIDEFLAAGSAPAPDFVKIDVEGAELEVIDGMRETLARHRPVVMCEVHDCNAQYAELMASLGYKPVNLDEVDVPVEYGHRNAHTLAKPSAPPASA
jgi:FkbM family methyltransferase